MARYNPVENPVQDIGWKDRVSSGNGNLRTLGRSKNYPTEMKRFRIRLQLVLRENWQLETRCRRDPFLFRTGRIPAID